MTPTPNRLPALALFALSLALLLATAMPSLSFYHIDSAEFVTAAHTLGIPHPPGYPLYVLLAGTFARLPFGDPAWRVNLLSVLALALTVPVVYRALCPLLDDDRPLAASVTLLTVFSFHVWQTGVAAEVYAPGLLALALVGWSAVAYARDRSSMPALTLGVAVGLALALNPANVTALGFAAAVMLWRPRPRHLLTAAAVALVLALTPLLYFPLRAGANPAYNAAGVYDGAGVFQPLDLRTVSGVWTHLSGARFGSLYFAEGWDGLRTVLFAYAVNGYWVGAALAGVGVVVLMERRTRLLLLAWLVSFAPFTAFYATYGASDKITMLAPGHVLLALPVAFGLRALMGGAGRQVRLFALTLLVVMVVGFNGAVMRAARAQDVRGDALFVLEHLPPDAVVFGRWEGVTPLQYLQLVEGHRPDMTLYNLFFFTDASFAAYLAAPPTSRPVVFLMPQGNSPAQSALLAEQNFVALVADGRAVGYLWAHDDG